MEVGVVSVKDEEYLLTVMGIEEDMKTELKDCFRSHEKQNVEIAASEK